MNSKKLTLVIILLFTSLANAQVKAKEETKVPDPLDISKEIEQINKYGTPTISTVDELGKKAEVLYESQSWKEAIVAFEDYAKNANWIANLLSQCVEPYYSASYDDKKRIPYTTIKAFTPFESKSNQYKQSRNRAYVKIGLCYKKLGDTKKATAYLYKGLDLVDMDDVEYWNLAKDALAEIIQFDSTK